MKMTNLRVSKGHSPQGKLYNFKMFEYYFLPLHR